MSQDAIQASSVSVRSLSDNTLRITFDFEPKDAQAAFRMFGATGTSVAVCALVGAKEAASEAIPEHTEPAPISRVGHRVSREAALMCRMPDFWRWCGQGNEGTAADWVRDACAVESRANFDTDSAARDRFIRLVRVPYMHYCNRRAA